MTSIEIREQIYILFEEREKVCKPINDKIEVLLQEMRLQLERERIQDLQGAVEILDDMDKNHDKALKRI